MLAGSMFAPPASVATTFLPVAGPSSRAVTVLSEALDKS